MREFDNLVLDGMNIFKTALATGRDLKTSTGVPSGAVFHSLRTMASAYSNFKFTNILLLWDRAPYWRKALFPEYKGDRKRERSEEEIKIFQDQYEQFREMISLLGIAQIEAESFEADDLAYSMKAHLQGDTLFWSNDHDWLQLIDERHSQYLPRVKQLITYANYLEETGYKDPEHLIMIKVLCGDSDNIPGIPGVGPIRAEKFLRGELSGNLLHKINDFMSSPQYDLNRTLIDLSRCPADPLKSAVLDHGSPDIEKFFYACAQLEITSFSNATWKVISDRAANSVIPGLA